MTLTHDMVASYKKLHGDVSSVTMMNSFVSIAELEAICSESDLQGIFESTLELCARYTQTVCEFNRVRARGEEAKKTGDYAEIDQRRARIHDATIDQINILARNLAKAGKECGWIKKVQAGSRAGYTKFALTITFEQIQRHLNKEAE